MSRPTSPTPPRPSPEVRGIPAEALRQGDHRQLLPPVQEGQALPPRRTPRPHEPAYHDTGLRLIRRCAAHRLHVGQVRPDQSEEPPPPLLDPGREAVEAGADNRARRYAAGPARAAAQRPRRGARRRALHTRSRRPHARHRRPAHGRLRHEAARRLLFRCAHPREPVVAVRLLLHDTARLQLSANSGVARISSPESRSSSTGQGDRSRRCLCCRSTAISRRSASASATSPIRPTSRRCAWNRKAPCAAWISGSSTPCAARRIRAISALKQALEQIERAGAKRAILTHMTGDLDCESAEARAAAPRRTCLRRHGHRAGLRLRRRCCSRARPASASRLSSSLSRRACPRTANQLDRDAMPLQPAAPAGLDPRPGKPWAERRAHGTGIEKTDANGRVRPFLGIGSGQHIDAPPSTRRRDPNRPDHLADADDVTNSYAGCSRQLELRIQRADQAPLGSEVHVHHGRPGIGGDVRQRRKRAENAAGADENVELAPALIERRTDLVDLVAGPEIELQDGRGAALRRGSHRRAPRGRRSCAPR